MTEWLLYPGMFLVGFPFWTQTIKQQRRCTKCNMVKTRY